MTTAQVVETSVTVNNSRIQDYDYPDDHARSLLTNCVSSISGMFPVASARAPSVPSVALYLNENGNLSIPENLVMTSAYARKPEGRTELRQ